MVQAYDIFLLALDVTDATGATNARGRTRSRMKGGKEGRKIGRKGGREGGRKGPQYIVQADLKLAILLHHSTKCWDYKTEPPGPELRCNLIL
jgi:hypothetical protein